MASNTRTKVESKFIPVANISPSADEEPLQEPNCLVVKRCCCAFTLETGCRIISWLQVVLGIMAVIIPLYLMHNYKNQPYEDLIKVVGVIAIVGGVISTALGCLLLFGVATKRTALMFSWIVIFTAFLILGILSSVVRLMSGDASTILLNLLQFCVGFYYIMVVFSYYRSLKMQPPVVKI